RDAGLAAHGKAKAEAVADWKQRAADPDAGIEMIGGHQLQRLAADDALAVERATVEQHLAEARIVHGGGDEPATAGFEPRLRQRVVELNLLIAPGIDVEGLRNAARVLFAGREAGLRHLQGRENALGQERAEALAADDLDDAAEHVGRAAIVPFRARLADQ